MILICFRRVRKHTNLPFLMDEAVHDVESVLDVWKDGIADIMSIKISKFGGVTKMKQVLYRICGRKQH